MNRAKIFEVIAAVLLALAVQAKESGSAPGELQKIYRHDSSAAKWITFNPVRPGKVEIDGNQITWTPQCNVIDPDEYSPFNALYDLEVTNGTHYWEFDIEQSEESSISIGIGDKKRIGSGFRRWGLFYGGHQSTGSGLSLAGNVDAFDVPIAGIIGVLAHFTAEHKLQVYYFDQGRPLGMLYDIDAGLMPSIAPAIQFLEEATVKVSEKPAPPKSAWRPSRVAVEGAWVLLKTVGDKALPPSVDEDTEFVIHIADTEKGLFKLGTGSRKEIVTLKKTSVKLPSGEIEDSWSIDKFEPYMPEILKNATLCIRGDNLIVKSGDIEYIFLNQVKPFSGDPFEVFDSTDKDLQQEASKTTNFLSM